MDSKVFFRKAVLGAGALTLSISLVTGVLQPTKAEAIDLGKIVKTGGAVADTVAAQKKLEESYNYYENDGRNELFEQIKKSDGVVNDPGLNALLARIMTRLSNTIVKTEPSIKDRPYNYFINPQKEFNAYCTLGHNVSVNVGVFQFFDNNEDKIAAVVAHELVHGQKEHPIRGAKNKSKVDAGKKVLAPHLGGAEKIAADIIAVNVKNAGITKPNEWEADNIAFAYMVDSGYNPGAPAAVWQRVIENMGGGKSKGLFDDLLNPSTHPDGKQRRDNYSKKMTEYSMQKVAVDAATGEIKINNKSFMKPAAFANMSALERSYLIAGNLAAIYHSNEPIGQARNDNGIVKLGDKAVLQSSPADVSADELVRILNEIK